jgi:hypothetical protein
LIGATRRCMAEMERLGSDRVAEFDRSLIPTIDLQR